MIFHTADAYPYLVRYFSVLMQSACEDIEKDQHEIQTSDITMFYHVACFVTNFQHHRLSVWKVKTWRNHSYFNIPSILVALTSSQPYLDSFVLFMHLFPLLNHWKSSNAEFFSYGTRQDFFLQGKNEKVVWIFFYLNTAEIPVFCMNS